MRNTWGELLCSNNMDDLATAMILASASVVDAEGQPGRDDGFYSTTAHCGLKTVALVTASGQA